MSSPLERALEHLRWLVAADSQNPPRAPEALVQRLERELGSSLDVERTDSGDGCIALFARRGSPKVLFNFHVDTVPVSAGWTESPFDLAVDGERAVGLGACDTKGAAAAMLAVALASEADVALLFTTDEEAGQGRCVREFCARKLAFELVVVAEPTEARAVLSHRGVGTGMLAFHGTAAHSSTAAGSSANHALVRWASAALAWAHSHGDLRFNVGRIEGGLKPNVVAAEAMARFGVRPPPAESPKEVLAALARLAEDDAVYTDGFFGPPLRESPRARDFAERHGLPVGPAADFWTEAALFAEAGYPAMVLGAGSIAQAHGANEFVPLADLARLTDHYHRLLHSPPPAEPR